MVVMSQIDEYIDNLYRKIEIKTIEDLTIENISSRLGITVTYFAHNSQSIRFDGKKYIFIDKRLSPQIQWQQFAHELCHTLWHYGNQLKMSNKHSMFMAYQEIKAEVFALYACMPTCFLNNCNLENMEYKEALYFIQKTFNVGINFAKKRLDKHLESTHCIARVM